MFTSIEYYLTNLAWLITYYLLLKWSYYLIYFFYSNLFRKRINIYNKYSDNGKDKNIWALVTGGSDGIGKAIALELASMKFNIIVIARNQTKMDSFCKELETTYGIKTDNLSVDFDQIENTFANYEKIFKPLFDKYTIKCLVNNVGDFSIRKFKDLKIEHTAKMLNLNCYPQAYLSKMFVEVNKEKAGIINLSSSAAIRAVAMCNFYSATKKFNDFISTGMSLEENKLDIMSVKPLGVESDLSGLKADFFNAITAKQCARGIFNDFGYERETLGHWSHKIQGYFFGNLYDFVATFIIKETFKKRENKWN